MPLGSDFPPLARLADELLDGGLVAFIEQIRARPGRQGWDRVAREIWAATDGRVEANGVTVQRWWERLAQEAVA